MINQITMSTNIDILIKKISRLHIDQRVIIRYTIGVLMVSLMRLKIKKNQKIEKSKVVSQQSKKVPTNMI
jgi:hypothetical protein